MKIGIMGGTFDPIHNGHLTIAEAAYRQFGLDSIWFMPNGNPPHKEKTSIGSDVEHRIRMVKLAIAGHEGFRLERYEADKRSVSCSYETMEHFKKVHPEDEFYFIIGADSLFAIETWVHPERLFPTCTILAAYRDEKNTAEEMERQIEYLREKYGAKLALLRSPLVDVSSTELRERIRRGENVREYIPDLVGNYITEERLYGSKDYQDQ